MDYDVMAVFPGRGVTRLTVAAESPELVASAPALQGGVVVSLRQLGQRKAKGRGGKFPLPLFTRQMLSLLKAGLTVVEGLETLSEQDQGSATSEILSSLLVHLRDALCEAARPRLGSQASQHRHGSIDADDVVAIHE